MNIIRSTLMNKILWCFLFCTSVAQTMTQESSQPTEHQQATPVLSAPPAEKNSAVITGRQLSLDNMQTIKIALHVALTGRSASSGISAKNGALLAADEINKAGGVLGKHLEIVFDDDQSKESVAVEMARQNIAANDIVAVAGFCNSGPAMAVGPIYQNAQVPMMVTVATVTKLTTEYAPEPENYIFRVGIKDEMQISMMLNDAINRKGLKKIAIITDTSLLGKLGRAELLELFKKFSLQPVLDLQFEPEPKDVSALVTQLIQYQPEGVLLVGSGQDMGLIVHEVRKAGGNQVFIGNWAMSYKAFAEATGSGGNGSCMPQSFIQAGNMPHRRIFIDDYIDRFKPHNRIIEAPVAAAQTYDGIRLLAKAINQAQSVHGKDILKALENLEQSYFGLIKEYNQVYSHNNHEALEESSVVMGMWKNGKVAFAYRDDSKKLIEKYHS